LSQDAEYIELLNYAERNGIIDISRLKIDVEMSKREEYLKRHTYNIWQGKNGYWYTNLYDENSPSQRKKIKKSTREKLEDAIVEYYREQDRIPRFGECFNSWQKYSLECGKVSKNTYDRRECDYNRFIKGSKMDRTSIDRITETDIILFLDDVLKRFGGQIARKAFNNMKSLITGTFVYAKVIRRINCIYTRELMGSYSPSPRQFKRPKMYLQVFADDEVEMIINRITSLYWDSERHLGLLFMLFTGVRVGELATLKTFDFLPGGKLHIQRTISKAKDESGKSHRIISDFPKTPTSDSIVYLSDDAMTVYQQVMKLRKEKGITSEFLFSEKGTYIADTIFDKTMRKLCTELDIPVRSCHKLRKTYCSELLDLGISEKIVQNQMRHADIATTKGHYYFSTKKEAAIKEALNRNNKLCVNI